MCAALLAGGRVHCAPSVGMAVRDRFMLVAAGWSDDDLPLAYRWFSTAMTSNAAAVVRLVCSRC
jgi:hypothetical protein